jgi:hypothetical protein
MKLTPFEEAVQAVANGEINTPTVSVGSKNVDYFRFQFASHMFYMGIFASGMKARNISLKTLKTYYGLRSKSAMDCLAELKLLQIKFNEEWLQEKM